MHFLCDAIDLKQSVEGTVKVYGKSLTTVLDKVHFIVKLYVFIMSCTRFRENLHSIVA